MKTVFHPAGQRGRGEHGWISTRYSFSFADWYEPSRMGFGKLRVLNDDLIAPSSGFGEHGHRDMEIVTIVMEGAVTHEDSMGNTAEVKADEVQVMSAGTGVIHTEKNASPKVPLALFQIWIEPRERGIEPAYAQKHFDFTEPRATTLVSPKGPLKIHQDATFTLVNLKAGELFTYEISAADNGVYIFVIEGEAQIGNYTLSPRDALGISETEQVEIVASRATRLLLIEVSMTENRV